MSGRKVYLIPGRDEATPRKGIAAYPCPRKSGCNQRKSTFHISPSALQRLHQLAKDRLFPAPRYMKIHTGAKDKGCDPNLAERFASLI